jgi:diguanylate cyclase (GGDEF)-like protein
MLAGFLANCLVGIADYLTGYELVLSVFYVLPVALVSWYAGLALGLATAVISAGIWLTADIASGYSYSHPLIAVWNVIIRLALFAVVTYLLVALRKSMRLLAESSQVDNMTGAVSTSFFYATLEKELDRLNRYGRPLTLAYVDLDGFKAVNDRFGHLEGDKVLRMVAECAQSRLRKTDVVARLGGDEFAFLCPETDEAAARAAIAEVMERLGEEMRMGGWPVTFSVGVVTCHAVPESSEGLVKMADDLMYSVKLSTKDGVSYASFGCEQSDSEECDEQTLLGALRKRAGEEPQPVARP